MSDFSMFELDINAGKIQKLPDWPELRGSKSDIAQAMYLNILEHRDTIINNFNNGVNLLGKERKIVLSDISTSVGKNTSYLNKREFPTLVRFIAELNDQLSRLKPTGTTPTPKSKMSTAELKRHISELEKQLQENNFSQLLTDCVIAQLGPLRQRNIKIERESRELTEHLHMKNEQNAVLIDQVSELLTEIQALKKQIRSLGHEPDHKANVIVVK